MCQDLVIGSLSNKCRLEGNIIRSQAFKQPTGRLVVLEFGNKAAYIFTALVGHARKIYLARYGGLQSKLRDSMLSHSNPKIDLQLPRFKVAGKLGNLPSSTQSERVRISYLLPPSKASLM